MEVVVSHKFAHLSTKLQYRTSSLKTAVFIFRAVWNQLCTTNCYNQKIWLKPWGFWCIRLVTGSNLGLGTDYPDLDLFSGLSQLVQASSGIVSQIRRRSFTSRSFQIRYSLITLPLRATGYWERWKINCKCRTTTWRRMGECICGSKYSWLRH
jgi:hypothetical protein